MWKVLATVLLIACSSSSLEPLPLQISITPNKLRARAGEEVIYRVDAQGGSLLGISITFGDGASELRPTAGARTARVHFSHTFPTAGNYNVEATVEDALAGSKSARIAYEVIAP